MNNEEINNQILAKLIGENKLLNEKLELYKNIIQHLDEKLIQKGGTVNKIHGNKSKKYKIIKKTAN